MIDAVDDRRLSFHLAMLGDELVVLGMSAETVVEYAAQIRAMFPGKMVVCVGFIDGVCGYLPTSAMLKEGGLEANSPGYDLRSAKWRENISSQTLESVRKLQSQCKP